MTRTLDTTAGPTGTAAHVVPPVFDRYLDDAWLAEALAADVRDGLAGPLRQLTPRWLYDDVGSELFDEITRLPEYYPTEAERSILRRFAAEIVDLSGADAVIELGSGTSDKTRTLLDAFHAAGALRRFVPLDVSEATLRDAGEEIATRYPGVIVHGVVGDFNAHLAEVPTTGSPIVLFLGSTIGNLYPDERAGFLAELASHLPSGSSLLLGADLVKPVDRLVAAYDDAAGVTARFTKNVLCVLNREVGADFDVEHFDHVALYDPVNTRMDLRLRSAVDQTVAFEGLDDLDTIDLVAGEELRVEISTKFTVAQLSDELGTAGFDVERWWTDDNCDVAVLLARTV